MRLGALVRADNRGLGIQTAEFHRNMRPVRTLVVSMGDFTPYQERFDRYPGCPVVQFDGHHLHPRSAVIDFLDDVDVVYSAETPYDYELLNWARERGVRTVIQPNYEFFRWTIDPDLPRPDLFLAPSTWYYGEWPEPKALLPFPVARDRLPFRLRTEATTFLHIAGHRAMGDRNGTKLVMQSVRYIRTPINLVIRSQSPVSVNARSTKWVKTTVIHDDIEDYAALYDGADVLVAPRRFGGQSLPMNEAASCGMPIISLDVEPQQQFLPADALVPAQAARRLYVQPGTVDIYSANPKLIAAKIEQLATDPALVERLSKESDAYAESISWAKLAPIFRSLLAG